MTCTQNVELVYPAERKTTGAGKNSDGNKRKDEERKCWMVSYLLDIWPVMVK